MYSLLKISIFLLLTCSITSLLGSTEEQPSFPREFAEDQHEAIPPASSTPRHFAFSHNLSQEFSVNMPPLNLERTGLDFGFGAGLVYENYMLNLLFSKKRTLPGILLGARTTFLVYVPGTEDITGVLKNSSMITPGIYGGYQFLIPITRSFSISPSVYAGSKYYFSIHYFDGNMFSTENIIFLSGTVINFIFSNDITVSTRIEYELSYEGIDPETGEVNPMVHTFQFSLGLGRYF